MASPPDQSPGNSSKKRVAARQLSKDDDPDNEETPVEEGATFQRASEAVLANRRIVKVRRTPATGAGTAPNPFASIRLVPPSASVPQEKPPAPALSAKPLTPDERKAGEKGEARGGDAVGPSGSSSETFQQLSSAKNAFSGSFGTGFTSTTFSFGNTQSSFASSSGFASFSSGGSFGSGTSFGSGLFGSSSTTGAATFPSLSSVFGKANGSTTPFQLFGTPSADTLPPLSGQQNPCGLTLQEVPLETGEEKEKAVFTADASLFEFLDGGWKERGKGELRVNIPEEKDRRARLVMRSKGNYRLLLNASLFPDMKLTKMDNRGVTFACANSAGEGKQGLTTYAVKMKDGMVAAEFFASVHDHKGNTNAEPRTPESSPKAHDRPSKVRDESSKDIETGVEVDAVVV